MSTVSLALVVAAVGALVVACAVLIRRLPPQALTLSHAGACRRKSARLGCSADAALLAFRAVTAVWGALILAVQLARGPSFYLSFFTVWSWTLLTVYFGCAAAASCLHLKQPQRQHPGGAGSQTRELWAGGGAAADGGGAVDRAASEAFGSSLARCNQLLLSTLSTAALMLDFVLWTVLLPADPTPGKTQELGFFSYNMHALNLVLVAVEMSLNSLPFRMQDLAVALLWPLTYSAFTVLRVAASGARGCLLEWRHGACGVDLKTGVVVWPYFFMDTSKPFAVLWYSALAIIFIAAYFAILGIHRCTKRQSGSRADAEQSLAVA